MSESFSADQTIDAIEGFLKLGEDTLGEYQNGYFSGHGWAARCLRTHLEALKGEPPTVRVRKAGDLYDMIFPATREGIGAACKYLINSPEAQL